MSHTILEVSYNVFKSIFNSNISRWNVYKLFESEKTGEIWTGNSEYIYHSYINADNFSDFSSSLNLNSVIIEQPDDALANLIGLGALLEPRQEITKALKVVQVGRTGIESIISSHNFCDKTTWFFQSERIVSESLSNSGDNLTFSGSNLFWIDLLHGKMHKEDIWNSNEQYSVEIFVDGVKKTQRLNWDNSGGDFTVNYNSGSITFFNEVTSSVYSNYSFANGSQFILCPEAGEIINIEDAEAQFSTDVEYDSSIEFRIYGYAAVFAPFLIESNGGPFPDDYKIELPGEGETYKSIFQIIDEARGSYPQIPKINGLRGMKNAMNGFPFNYATIRSLDSTYGLELRVGLSNDKEFGGERATATFYTTISPV
jgi:hypothetical protein